MELKDTVSLMTSEDYKERFKAEFYQLENRITKLENMLKKWDSGELNFTPTCPREMYDDQIDAMSKYYKVLLDRAELENIDIEH